MLILERFIFMFGFQPAQCKEFENGQRTIGVKGNFSLTLNELLKNVKSVFFERFKVGKITNKM